MPRIIRTARGESIDFDAIIIKQQLAQAPMNIEVAQRKRFIDSKEEKPKRTFIDHNATNQPTVNVVVPTDEQIAAASRKDSDFEPEGLPAVMEPMDGPVPVLPVRNKKA
jgi:hypothetical protein